ncbi:NADP-dependent oxidoreductase [Amycolatopsis sp. GM8]|uniref:NADP-dependent oxidoreductase n=1 Tax=Amycolatopsis sp. GM8 TaxID=2896530 RepID=UPI001F18A442|nr:NADP-dependent oxidoreductase [Amycolatopsis sp. GM8]
MKALVATAYGPPEQLSIAELAVPRPGPGQIQVKIAASAINPTDVRVVAGDYRALTELEFPYVPGNEFAGTVTETGPGVTGYQAGDEVFGQAMPRQLSFVAGTNRPSLSTGALAEYAVFEADTPHLAHRPANVPVEQAAALPIAGTAAYKAAAVAGIRPGETVLVIGATGGVGTALLPLLAVTQAKIIATAATAADGEILRGLGADEIVGYDDYPSDVDVVLNLVLHHDRLPVAARALRPGGRLVTIIFPEPTQDQLGRDDVELHYLLDAEGKLGGMREIAEAAASGRLKVRITGSYRLDDAVQAAVDYMREHTVGKIVVTM